MLTRTSPLERFRGFDRMDQMLENLFEMPSLDLPRLWAPLVDIKETETDYRFMVDLAGVHEEDVTVDLVGDVLTIAGKREKSIEDKKEDFLRIERSYGSFQRRFTLSGPVDKDKVAAEFVNGLLTVTVPKSKVEDPVRIPIQKR